MWSLANRNAKQSRSKVIPIASLGWKAARNGRGRITIGAKSVTGLTRIYPGVKVDSLNLASLDPISPLISRIGCSCMETVTEEEPCLD